MNARVKVIASVLVLFAALTYLFAWSSIFSVRSISATGAPAGVSEAALISKSEILIGEKLSRIEPRSIERSLEELSWIKSAAIERNWIKGSVAIAVIPRVAVGMYKGKAIDGSGTLFIAPGKIPAGLPQVSAASPKLGLAAIALFTNLPLEIRESIISVSAANENSISSWQEENGRNLKVTWGSVQNIDLKVTVLKALLALPENQSIKRVDLSAPHAPIVK
ncbi:MAG: FtsQ-type POTRA domain-containing protein [Candidatus Planktophila sp.]|jgi:cell division septal protein FtsQ|nr:FtsQ-type POTRA domain-containing protein [Candidatus Planktophila sp.]MBP7903396.1 FtsQ-type POTRA domain-containing protein [Candidatus Planktophila sp.]